MSGMQSERYVLKTNLLSLKYCETLLRLIAHKNRFRKGSGYELFFSAGYGKANIKQDINNTSKTKFRIGSITKTFTAVSILQMVDQGRLKLEDTVSRYLPLQHGGDIITISHLLSHTSGIPNFTDNILMKEWSQEYVSPEEIFARFFDKELDFPPGLKFKYSNSGYILLGLVLEKVLGRSYPDIIYNSLLQPLKMKDTEVEVPLKTVKDFATGYEYDHTSTLIDAPFFNSSNAYAAGSLISTVEDLFLWDQGLESNRVLSKHLTDRMFEPVKANFEYGYGWFVQNTPFGKAVLHSGSVTGFTSMFLKFLDTRITIIILSNISQDLSELSKELALMLHSND